MYKLEITQGNNAVYMNDVEIENLTEFIDNNINLFGPETTFTISSVVKEK